MVSGAATITIVSAIIVIPVRVVQLSGAVRGAGVQAPPEGGDAVGRVTAALRALRHCITNGGPQVAEQAVTMDEVVLQTVWRSWASVVFRAR